MNCKNLIKNIKKNGGRNNLGIITNSTIGGGKKKKISFY